jgi:hypothetical protein
MDTRTIVVAAAMMTVAGAAEARERAPLPTQTVTVCMGTPVAEAGPAQMVTSEIFARIGVWIDWRSGIHCPAGAIQISFQDRTERSELPGALAYALPYERVHIRVFYDRVRSFGSNGETSLLGYVLAHELGHILQGVARHSKTGVMKAAWDDEDRFNMYNQRLGFSSLDADLIHEGIEGRASGIVHMPQTLNSGKIVRGVSGSGL